MEKIAETFDLNPDAINVTGAGLLPSRFAVSDLLAHSIGAAGGALARLMADTGLTETAPRISVDRRLAALWAGRSIEPVGWSLPPTWDAIAGDYQTADGWIKLHTNLPHHRAAALCVLGCANDRAAVTAAVATWTADALETAIVDAGGVSAAMRSRADWLEHANGAAVALEPLVAFDPVQKGARKSWDGTATRPLNGLKVLDLTRVLAGPVSTRTLAGFGAQVLRIDPPGWDEAHVVPDITLGKRCAMLDLTAPGDRARFESLLSEADVLIHGYRPEALSGLGYGTQSRASLRPGLIEVTLDAYGWTGPWANRRGFDSLVQMSCGIAHAGMGWAGTEVPTPLPVQALDHATGYLMAAAALTLLRRAALGQGRGTARLSLARTGDFLMRHRQEMAGGLAMKPAPDDYAPRTEITPWGDARRLKPALDVEGAPMQWDRPAAALGSSPAAWRP